MASGGFSTSQRLWNDQQSVLLRLVGLFGSGGRALALLHLFVFRHSVTLLSFQPSGDALLRLVVDGVLSAEGAVFVQLQAVRGILLVLHGVVVSLLALRAPQGDLDASTGLACHMFGTSFKYCGERPVRAAPLM